MAHDEHLTVLCRRLGASDRAAFADLFRLLRPPLLRYVAAIVHDASLAHDLVQDVFVDLWQRRTRLDVDKPLKPYLYRMARNRALRHLRDERTHARKHTLLRPGAPDVFATTRAEHAHDQAVLNDHLQRWVADLPTRQREALVLSRLHGLSHREIAAVMAISPRTVNNHIVRALETLQTHLHTFESTPWTP